MTDLETFLDRVVVYMALSEPRKGLASIYRQVTPRDVSGAEILHAEFPYGLAASEQREGTFWVPHDNIDGRRELVRSNPNLDMRLLSAGFEEGSFSLERFRVVSGKQVRGRVTRVMPRMIEVQTVQVGADGHWYSGEVVYFGWEPAFASWVSINPVKRIMRGRRYEEYATDPESTKDYQRRILAAHSSVEGFGNLWRVELGYEGQPSVRFPSDPTGVREVFRLRDIPNGAQRRAALRHWVSDHWRSSRDGTALAYVRKHLRGATSFSWNGLTCKILIPKADADLAAGVTREVVAE